MLGMGVAVKRGVKDTIGPSVRVGTVSTAPSSFSGLGDGVSVATSSQAAKNSTNTMLASRPNLQCERLHIPSTSPTIDSYKNKETMSLSSLTAIGPLHNQRFSYQKETRHAIGRAK
jgi:hypothetical protein